MNNLDVLYDSNYNDRKKELDELWKSFKSQRSGNGIIRGSWRAKFGSRWKKGFETFGQHFVWQSLTANKTEKPRNTWRLRTGSSVPKVCSRLNDNISVCRAQPFQVFLLKSKLPVFEAAEWFGDGLCTACQLWWDRVFRWPWCVQFLFFFLNTNSFRK